MAKSAGLKKVAIILATIRLENLNIDLLQFNEPEMGYLEIIMSKGPFKRKAQQSLNLDGRKALIRCKGF